MIDCHCHVIDPARFPYRPDTAYRPSGQEIAPVDHLLRMMDLHGVRHGLVVGTVSGYGEDPGPVLDAIAVAPERFKGIAVVAPDISTAALARLKAQGVIGVAFNTTLAASAYRAPTPALLWKLAELDMVVQLQVRDDQLLDLLPSLDGAAVRLVVDHCGRPAPDRGLDQPGFRALLALGRAGRASVKLSGFSQFSRQRYPYPDVVPFVDALIDAFTLDRCVWGSDWPFLRAPERIDYAPLLRLVETIVPCQTGRNKLLWETPLRLFGFGGGAAGGGT